MSEHDANVLVWDSKTGSQQSHEFCVAKVFQKGSALFTSIAACIMAGCSLTVKTEMGNRRKVSMTRKSKSGIMRLTARSPPKNKTSQKRALDNDSRFWLVCFAHVAKSANAVDLGSIGVRCKRVTPSGFDPRRAHFLILSGSTKISKR